MHSAMSNVPPRYHAEIHELKTQPMSKLNKIHLQLAIVYCSNGPSMSMCIPRSDMRTLHAVNEGTVCCNKGNCDADCLLYYSTRFEKALKLLEELQDAIETKNVVLKNAPKPREH